MNERIKEFANKVSWNSDVSYTELQDFAELIILECAKQVEDYYQEDHSFGLDAAYIIKQHFGME